MEKKRIVAVDIMRGIAVVCMIIGHSVLRYPINISELEPYHTIEYIIFTFHMELFFVLAGYVYRCDNYKKYVQGKLKRILIPYCVFGTINAFLHTYGGSFVNGTEPLKDSLLKFLLQGGEYWFLYTIIIIYMVFPFIEKYLDWRVECVIIIVSIVLSDLIASKLFCIQLALYHFPYFYIGYLLRVKASKQLEHWSYQKKGLVIPLLSILLFILTVALYSRIEISIIRIVRAFSAIVVVYYISKLISVKLKLPLLNKFLCNCSNYSLQIYLFNGYLLVMYRVLICNILKVSNPVLIISILPIFIIGTSLIICKATSYSKLLSVIVGIKQRER